MSILPTPAQAACFWVYCWDEPVQNAGRGGNLGAIVAVGAINAGDPSLTTDVGTPARVETTGLGHNSGLTLGVGALAAIAIISATNAGGGS